MSHGSGFLSGIKAKLTQPQHEFGQRERVFKQYQEKISILEDKINDLERNKACLETDLTIAFRERLALVESREEASKELEKNVSLKKIAIDQEVEEHSRQVSRAQQDYLLRLDEIRAERHKNESILKAIQDRQGTMDANIKRVDDYGARIAAREEICNQRDRAFEEKKNALDHRIGQLKAEDSRLEVTRKEIQAEMGVLSLSRQTNETKIQELMGILSRLGELRNQIRSDRENLRIEKEENRRLIALAKSTKKGV